MARIAQQGVGPQLVTFTGTLSAVAKDEPLSTSSELVESPEENLQVPSANCIMPDENAQMRMLFNRAMCKEMEVPDGYQNVAVLIIKWTKHLDQLDSGAEVKQIHELFRDEFNYSTEIFEINDEKKPQLQLDMAIAKFTLDYDGPHNLLIVYYTGHASYNENTEIFELHASNSDISTEGFRACVDWQAAEKPLREHSESDVLAIFDTCFASNLFKDRRQDDPRTYELLCATGHDQTTIGPGKNSFTTALISALRDLLKERKDVPFSTIDLCQKICINPARRKHQPRSWSYFKHHDRPILLAPLKSTLVERKKEFKYDQEGCVLSLRLSLSVKRPSGKEIEGLAREFSKAVKKIKAPVKRINWWKLESSQGSLSLAGVSNVINLARQWKNRKSGRNQVSPTTSRDRNPPPGGHQAPQMTNQSPLTAADYSRKPDNDLAILASELTPPMDGDILHKLDSELAISSVEPKKPAQLSHKRKHTQRHNEVEEPTAKRRATKDLEESPDLTLQSNPLTPSSGTLEEMHLQFIRDSRSLS